MIIWMVFLYQTTDTTVQPQNVTTKRITSHWGLGCHGSGLPWIVEFTALKIWATQAWRFHSLRKSDLLGKSGDWLRKVVIETAHGDSTCKCGDLISKHGDSTRTHADLSDLTSKHLGICMDLYNQQNIKYHGGVHSLRTIVLIIGIYRI